MAVDMLRLTVGSTNVRWVVIGSLTFQLADVVGLAEPSALNGPAEIGAHVL